MHSVRTAWPWWLFAAAQVLFWAGLGGAALRRTQELDLAKRLPIPRTEPLRIRPQYDYDWIITDEQLQRVLEQLQPRFRGEKPRINYVDHALRFWGVSATFPDPQALSGKEMRDLLTQHSKFRAQWGAKTPSLLTGSAQDVSVRTREGTATASHVDHTLASLAECGTPIDFPVQTPTAQASVKSLLAHSLRSFSVNQVEYEWSALIYALYIPQKKWLSKEGQEVTFDLLADRLMRQRYSQGVCFGNHRLYTLAILLRVDETEGILTTEMRQRVIAHLAEATRRLLETQAPDGSWDGGWSGEKLASSEGAPSALGQRILATGHALEWWAMAPAEVHPPREVLVRAAQWLYTSIDGMDAATVEKNYTFLSHAGRCLALWRACDEPARRLPPATDATTEPAQPSDPPAAAAEGDAPTPLTAPANTNSTDLAP